MSRAVLVLGSTSPIGNAICAGFLAQGDRVAGISKAGRCPSGVIEILCDCVDPVAATSAVAQARGEVGEIDVLVLAAGQMPVASAVETTDSDWESALANGLTAGFNVLRSCLAGMTRGSSVVAIGSVNSFLFAPGLPAYSAAKSGLEGLVRQVAVDYGPRGIRANVVAPGLVSAHPTPDQCAGYPLGRVATPEDVAAAVLFLSSPAASFITGVTLPVDGGLSIASPAAFLREDLKARFPK